MADKLAKETNPGGREYGRTCSDNSNGRHKKGTKILGFVKRQRKWELAETGRHLFDFKPKIQFKDRFTVHTKDKLN